MRLSHTRASAAIACLAALATILGMIGVGELPSWRDHDGFVRPVRASFQRLKTTDACAYEYEPPDPVVAPAAMASQVADAHVAPHDRLSVHAPPGAAIRPTMRPDASPVFDFVLLSY